MAFPSRLSSHFRTNRPFGEPADREILTTFMWQSSCHQVSTTLARQKQVGVHHLLMPPALCHTNTCMNSTPYTDNPIFFQQKGPDTKDEEYRFSATHCMPQPALLWSLRASVYTFTLRFVELSSPLQEVDTTCGHSPNPAQDRNRRSHWDYLCRHHFCRYFRKTRPFPSLCPQFVFLCLPSSALLIINTLRQTELYEAISFLSHWLDSNAMHLYKSKELCASPDLYLTPY